MGVIDERAEGITVREEDKEFIARVYSYVFIGIMLDWIKDDMKADPKLIVDKLAILMKDSLADALRRFVEYESTRRVFIKKPDLIKNFLHMEAL